eukprot:SAG31_NODE_18602_length_630_cov_0.772128_1_plen_196_part_01
MPISAMFSAARTVPFLLSALASVAGHGAMIHPKPRNAVDGGLPINNRGGCRRTAERPNYCYSCNCGCVGSACEFKENGTVGNWNANCTPGTRANMNGQPCLWFSQGCTIGCDQCDNSTSQTQGKSLCGKPMKPTLPRHAWTINRFAGIVEGSENDTCSQVGLRSRNSLYIYFVTLRSTLMLAAPVARPRLGAGHRP